MKKINYLVFPPTKILLGVQNLIHEQKYGAHE